jgi:hypothetical protein
VAVAFGAPLRWSDLARARGIDLARFAEAPEESRRATAKEVAAELMSHIARAIPATPVPLLARAVLDLEAEAREPGSGSADVAKEPAAQEAGATEAQLAARVRTLRAELSSRGVPIALGAEFAQTEGGRRALEDDEDRNRDLARLEGDLLALEEAEAIVALGLEHLVGRRVLLLEGGRVRANASAEAHELLEYYARSLSLLAQAPAELRVARPHPLGEKVAWLKDR